MKKNDFDIFFGASKKNLAQKLKEISPRLTIIFFSKYGKEMKCRTNKFPCQNPIFA